MKTVFLPLTFAGIAIISLSFAAIIHSQSADLELALAFSCGYGYAIKIETPRACPRYKAIAIANGFDLKVWQ